MMKSSRDLKILPGTTSLTTEYEIRGIRVPGRFFLAPINTGFTANGSPTQQFHDFHTTRSGRGIAVCVIGNVAISPSYTNSPQTAVIEPANTWRTLAEDISNNKSVPAIQLACEKSLWNSTPKWVNRNLDQFISTERAYLSSLDTREIRDVVDAFVDATNLAWEMGFRIIQIHAAHGYFLSKVINPVLNARSDRYGRCRWQVLTEIVESIRAINSDVILDLRLNATEGIESTKSELERTNEVFEHIADLPVDIVSISSGMYDVNRFQIYPREEDGHACYLKYAQSLASKYPHLIVNVAGNIWDIQNLDDRATQNVTFSLGRALIADPLFVEKSIAGRQEEVNKCVRAGYCHYFSRGKQHIECKVNFSIGKEGDSIDETQ